MDAELSRLFEQLSRAFGPEDVFGPLPGDTGEERLRALETTFHDLCLRCHPDRFASDPEVKELSHQTFSMLSAMRERARVRLERGAYGATAADDGPGPDETSDITTRERTFRVSRVPFCEGDLCHLFRGRCLGGDSDTADVVVKLARDVADNDLVRNEIRVLGRLWARPGVQLKHLPQLLDRFVAEGHQGLILRALDALDLTVVLQRQPAGLDAQHCAWILARLLSVVGFAHSRGVVHGNIEPAHVLIRPSDHNAFLIDWSYAAVEPGKTGEGFRVLNEHFSAPEVALRQPPAPPSDLYSLGKVMVALLSGDATATVMPDHVPARFRRFVEFMIRPSPYQRPQDAWELFAELRMVREELWGGPHYLALNL